MSLPKDSVTAKSDVGTGDKSQKPTSIYRKVRRGFAKTPLRVLLTRWRHRGLQPTDVFLAAYPKAGSTWARFVLFEVLTGQEAGFRQTNLLMPGIIGNQEKALRLLPGGGRLIATHEDYQKEYKKAIYITRDPRDTVLAEYAFYKVLDYYHGSLDEFIDSFLFTKNCSVYGYGPWHRHVFSWLNSPIAGTENLLVTRFEDLRSDPVSGFARVFEFLGISVSLEKIKRAIENNTVERMREKEDKEPVRSSIRGRFVRQGAVRGWLSKLTPEQVRRIEKEAGKAMARMTYPFLRELQQEAPPEPSAMEVLRETAPRI